jgi:class 3 adenylate cyclase
VGSSSLTNNQTTLRADGVELRLFIEELACNICRFAHASKDQIAPQSVRIKREVQLGTPDAFADIVVHAPRANYIVEVVYGHSLDRVSESISRKYQRELDWFGGISKLIVIFDRDNHPDQPQLERHVRALIPKHWELELWDEHELLARVREHFGVSVDSLQPAALQDVRLAIDRAKGTYAFGDGYENSSLDAALLWHLGYWRLREAFRSANSNKREILPPATYRAVAVVFADLSGFSGYVRDTPHEHTIRDCLTAFSSRSRYQIINNGGMLYQFLGDAVIGFFGIPDHVDRYVDDALDCARDLLMLGESVSNEWQRQLDRIQPVRGSHIGVALGDLQLLSLRPFSRTHLGAIGDVINMAARLSAFAKPGQIVVSNLVYRALADDTQRLLRESEPVEAKNVGNIKAWLYEGRHGHDVRG